MLEIENLETALIGPVSMRLAAGRIAVLSGPSGAGKSLLLRAIADLDPSRGAVRLGGRARGDMPAPEWRRRVGLVPAESGWWAARVGAHFHPAPDPAPVLSALGLPDALGWEVARLSTGERQRLALARALQLAPQVLLLDEPTSALDPTAVEAAEQVIRDTAAAGTAVLMVSHDPAQRARLGQDFFQIDAGRVRRAA